MTRLFPCLCALALGGCVTTLRVGEVRVDRTEGRSVQVEADIPDDLRAMDCFFRVTYRVGSEVGELPQAGPDLHHLEFMSRYHGSDALAVELWSGRGAAVQEPGKIRLYIPVERLPKEETCRLKFRFKSWKAYDCCRCPTYESEVGEVLFTK